MANQINYGGELISADEYLAKTQSIPQNTSADGNGGSMKLAGTMGAIEVVAVVTTAIIPTDTKVVTVKLQHSDDDSSYTDLTTLYTVTGSSTNVPAGTELARFILPSNTKKYVKANLSSNDTAVAGAVSIYCVYKAR